MNFATYQFFVVCTTEQTMPGKEIDVIRMVIVGMNRNAKSLTTMRFANTILRIKKNVSVTA